MIRYKYEPFEFTGFEALGVVNVSRSPGEACSTPAHGE
jgi:hypothetical protein